MSVNMFKQLADNAGLRFGDKFTFDYIDKFIKYTITPTGIFYAGTNQQAHRAVYYLVAGYDVTVVTDAPRASPADIKFGDAYKAVREDGVVIETRFNSNDVHYYRKTAGNMFAPTAVITAEQIGAIVRRMKGEV